MDEFLIKLLESVDAKMLSEDTKQEIIKEFNNAKDVAIKEAVDAAVVEAQVKLAEEYAANKEALIEALDTKTQEIANKKFEELQEDILRFRDLEVEHEKRIVESRHEMAEVVKGDFNELVNKLDVFLDKRLNEHFEELKEDFDKAREFQFGAKIFEAFGKEFKTKFLKEDSTQNELEQKSSELTAKNKELTETKEELKKIKHDKELNRVLESLHGITREIMENLIKPYPTEKLDEAYNKFIAKVLHEGVKKVEENAEKESVTAPVLAETNTSTNSEPRQTVAKTGDAELTEGVNEVKHSVLSEADKAWLRRQSGIVN